MFNAHRISDQHNLLSDSNEVASDGPCIPYKYKVNLIGRYFLVHVITAIFI